MPLPPGLPPLPEHSDYSFLQVSGHPYLCPWVFRYTTWSPGEWPSVPCLTAASHTPHVAPVFSYMLIFDQVLLFIVF